jgi:hypothetical protein
VANREEAKARVSHSRTLALIGGLLAGLVSFGVDEPVYNLIQPEEVLQGVSGRELMRPSAETIGVAAGKNAALAFGALGLCLAGFLGVAGGLARRSARAAVTAGLTGAVLGAGLGAGVSRAVVPSLYLAQYRYPDSELLVALLMHGAIWGLLGAAAGMAFAIGLGDRRNFGRLLTGGLVGAVLGAVAFDILGAVFLTSANTHLAISQTWLSRLLARLLVAIGTAAIMIVFLAEPRRTGSEDRAVTTAPPPAA